MAEDDDERSSPVGDIYREGISLPHNPANLLYTEQEKQWNPVEYQPVKVTGKTREALADVATQFHYIYLSQLVTLGDIIHNARWMEKKRASLFLAASRMRDVDAWGRYIGLIGESTTVSEEVRTFLDRLYNDDNRLSRLIGLIYVDVLRQSMAEHTESVPDPTFKALLDRDIEEGDRNVQLIRQTIQDIHSEVIWEEQQDVVARLDRYLAMMEEIVRNHEDVFNAFGTDADTVTDHVNRVVNEFEQTIQGE